MTTRSIQATTGMSVKVIAKLPEQRQDTAKQDRDKFPHDTPEWRGESQLDIPDFLFAVKENPGFRTLGKQHVLTLIVEINDARNLWAHPPLTEFRRAEVDRVAHKCAQVVSEFDEAAADEIRALTLERERALADQERNETLEMILEGVEMIRARSIHPEAMSDLVNAAGDSERIRALSAQLSDLEARITDHVSAQLETRHDTQDRLLQRLTDELAAIKSSLQPQSPPKTQSATTRVADLILGPGSAEQLARTWRRFWSPRSR